MTAITRPALRYHGAKFRLATWILQYFPPHRVYTEAFGAAAGVLLQKPRSHGEVYNDLDGNIVAFFRCLQSAPLRERLIEALTLTPYARAEFELAWQATDDLVERARRTAIRAQMGFGSAGATKGCTGLRTDTMRRGTTSQMDWAAYPPVLLHVAERFQQVLIEQRPAICVLRQHDSSETLHFVDPPYLHGTRVMSSRVYRHEMTDGDHAALLRVLRGLAGMIVLCGYASPLYASQLPDWANYQTRASISAGRGGSGLRTEVVWLNPACQAALEQADGGLFAGLP